MKFTNQWLKFSSQFRKGIAHVFLVIIIGERLNINVRKFISMHGVSQPKCFAERENPTSRGSMEKQRLFCS